MERKRDLPPLLVRADADANRGAGHVMRSLALARGWLALGGRVRFVTCRIHPALRAHIEAAGATVTEIRKFHPDGEDLRATVTALDEMISSPKRIPWVVADGYHFDVGYQTALVTAGCRLLIIDDNAHVPFYQTDVLLNHGAHALKLTYSCPPDTTLLLGTAYALLRPEFQQRARNARRTAAVARKILVTLGGSDPGNATYKVIQALDQVDVPAIEARIVVGPVNPHASTLNRLLSRTQGTITLDTAVSDMASLMLWADVAVAAAGGTCWELACLGVPMMNIIVADNQKMIAAELESAGVSVNLGRHEEISVGPMAAALNQFLRAPQRRAQMSDRGRAMVDGQGVSRVIDAMLKKNSLAAA